MFDKERVAIDITSKTISVLIGHKYSIADGMVIETPKGAYKDDCIKNVDAIADAIRPMLKKKKAKDAYFVLRGEDIIIRHIELPFMKDEALRDSVEFELRQVIGDRIEYLYFDFEVMNSKAQGATKAKIVVVAVEKTKVESYIELANKLKLKIEAIDAYATVATRFVRSLKKNSKSYSKTVGVLDLSADTSSISIIEWDKLLFERYQSFGIANAAPNTIESLNDYNDFLKTIDLTDVDIESNENIDRLMKTIVGEFNSFIDYCMTGKAKKHLDRLIVIGSGKEIRGIDKYLESYLNSIVSDGPDFSDIKLNVKAPKKLALKDYIYPYGLLLRKE
ncbi:MAG: pilus assembly protein PilM [Clostridium sp.]|uniref:type IV pilus biogenesis protein PilM n=1 Tax=Clostridium sp. TaxID=1506 RepID=UPI002FC6FA32